MDLLEIERRETLRREEVARTLHAVADALGATTMSSSNAGDAAQLEGPDEVRVKVELEVGEDETELEIELSF